MAKHRVEILSGRLPERARQNVKTNNGGDKMRSKLFFLLICLGMSLWPVGNAFAQGEEPYTANFIFNMPKQDTASPVDVTFTVFNPSYKTSGGLMWFSSKPFANLHSALQQDIQKVLMAKGFLIRGPFENYDLIPYQDKKRIDLLMMTTIELSVSLKDQNEKLENFWAYKPGMLQTGTAEVTGKIVIEAKETATRELMWVKPIDIKKFQFPYVVRVPWGQPITRSKLYSYEPIFIGMARGLEEQYPEIMNTFYKLLDPEEMTIIKKEARELKSKKGY